MTEDTETTEKKPVPQWQMWAFGIGGALLGLMAVKLFFAIIAGTM